MQRPRTAPRKLRIWVVSSNARRHTCAIMNAVNIVTPVSIKTLVRLMEKGKMGSVMVITDRLDAFGR